MSQTPITVTYDLKELLTNLDKKIDARFDQLESRFDKLENRFDKLETKVTALEIGQAEIRGDIKALDEKVSGLDKRLSNQEFLNRTTFGGLVVIIIGGVAKLVIDWFSNKP